MIINRQKATRLPKCCISAIVATALFVTSAEAAVLTNIEGTILVDHGNGFKPVAGSALVVPGDRVHAANGATSVLYENNCSEKVGPNQTVLVLAEPPACSLKDGVIANDTTSDFTADVFTAGSLLAFGGGVAAALASSGHGSSVSP